MYIFVKELRGFHTRWTLESFLGREPEGRVSAPLRQEQNSIVRAFPFTTGSRRKYAYCLQTQHIATHNTGPIGKRASAAVSRKNKVVRLG